MKISRIMTIILVCWNWGVSSQILWNRKQPFLG